MDTDARSATNAAADRLKDLGSFIREQRRSARKSLRRLADEAGVSNPYLSQIERGLRKPSAEILQSIARALRISAETLYVRAGILEERSSDLAEAILADPGLSESQKRSLLEVYRSFRQEGEEAAAPVREPGAPAGASGGEASGGEASGGEASGAEAAAAEASAADPAGVDMRRRA